MLRKFSAVFGLLTVIVTVAFASPAHALGPAQYCTSEFLQPSQACYHGGFNDLISVRGRSVGTAKTCSGVTAQPNGGTIIRGPYCTQTPGGWADSPNWSAFTVSGYPALSNHSPFQSRFEGLFFYYL